MHIDDHLKGYRCTTMSTTTVVSQGWAGEGEDGGGAALMAG